MIQLKPVAKPVELTDALVAELTANFKLDGSSVWQKSYIKEALLKISNNKCCYCECLLEEESSYMEVEHFHHKNDYPDEVMLWENLLPACRRCNGTKGTHDTVNSPIIHPINDKPKEHLSFHLYRLIGGTDLGKETIEILNLNDRTRLQKARFKLGSVLMENLELLHELSEEYFNNTSTSTRRKNRIKKLLYEQMLLATPPYQHAAVLSTILINDDNYQKVKQLFLENGFWTEEYEALEEEVLFCKLDLKNIRSMPIS